MKILLVAREYPPETGGGGIGSYMATLAPALVALGHEVHVLSCDFGQASRDYLDAGVVVHRRPNLEIRGFARLWRLLRAPEEAAGNVIGAISAYVQGRRLGFRPDVVEYPDWGAEGLIFALLRDRPLVCHLHAPLAMIVAHHGVELGPRAVAWISALERFAMRRAHAVTAPSDYTVGALRANGWLRRPDVEIVPLPVDWPAWSACAPVAGTSPVVLFLGKIVPLKAPEVLVDAISLLREEIPDARALFVARVQRRRDDGTPAFEWVGRSLDLSGCDFTGFVPRTELLPYAGKTRVFALTSTFESFSMAALEAMAAGRAAVVTDVTGVAEFVRDADAGAVVPPGDAPALAAALRPYLLDASFAANEGEKARAAVRARLDPQTIAVRRVAVYRRAMSAYTRARSVVGRLVSSRAPVVRDM